MSDSTTTPDTATGTSLPHGTPTITPFGRIKTKWTIFASRFKKHGVKPVCTHCVQEVQADGKSIEHFCTKCGIRYKAGYDDGRASVLAHEHEQERQHIDPPPVLAPPPVVKTIPAPAPAPLPPAKPAAPAPAPVLLPPPPPAPPAPAAPAKPESVHPIDHVTPSAAPPPAAPAAAAASPPGTPPAAPAAAAAA